MGKNWETFHFKSSDNPHVSQEAIQELAMDMSAIAYRQEILAEDLDEAPGALWTYKGIDELRWPKAKALPEMARLVVSIDPAGSSSQRSDEVGIMVVGCALCDCRGLFDALGRPELEMHGFVLEDVTGIYTPNQWANKAVDAYRRWKADRIVAETNFGGEMVKEVLDTIDNTLPFTAVSASRGKVARAEPVAVLYEQKKVHHVGDYTKLEDQMVVFVPGQDFKKSPDRADALVWGFTELMVPKEGQKGNRISPAFA
jgi:phage terminase large subunit-like protein